MMPEASTTGFNHYYTSTFGSPKYRCVNIEKMSTEHLSVEDNVDIGSETRAYQTDFSIKSMNMSMTVTAPNENAAKGTYHINTLALPPKTSREIDAD